MVLQRTFPILILMMIAVFQIAAGEPDENPGEVALRKLQVAPGLKASLFAMEPDVTNPVGIWVDDLGRVFLAETRRYNTAALYVKQHPLWYFDDLACRKVEDRLDVARKFMGERFGVLSEKSEVVRLLEDRTGTGRADRSVVFAEGFNSPADGVASGVLVRGNDVWLTNVPRLWKLRDTNGDGSADERAVLQDGYGVRFGNSGHDLHGLVQGPDGKLYFSMGDRGMHVEKEGKVFAYPDTGTVLRCELDGSNFEVFAYGLRNPQGLGFDDYGNLWTGDNNADVGDEARWVHVLEGGDSGWRTGFQYASDPWEHIPIKAGQFLVNFRGSLWMTENLWKGEAPYTVPPSGFVSRGPCGLTSYPGTGLSDRYKNYFFLCDFPGGIHAFGLKPKGASYEIDDLHKFLWECWPTDAKFGPDGQLYVCDWVHGFPMTGKGRVFRVSEPAQSGSAIVLETKRLLKEGMAQRAVGELAALLAHKDRRVRLEAQFELAKRKESSAFESTLKNGTTQLARIHAIWGLGQIGRGAVLVPLMQDTDAEIRAQACRVLGDLRSKESANGLIARLKDTHPRVRLCAAIALGRVGASDALAPLLEFFREKENGDGFLRHAGVMGLVGSGDVKRLLDAARDPSPAVRMGVLLALRRLESDEIRIFLKDADPALVLEAARAINDVPIAGGMESLASLVDQPGIPDGALLRAINANFRIGTTREAERLAQLALRKDAPANLRAEALAALGAWGNPSGRDRVASVWRPLPPREAKTAIAVLQPHVFSLLDDPGDEVRIAMARVAAGYRFEATGSALQRISRDTTLRAPVRIEAIRAMMKLHSAGLEETVGVLVSDSDADIRKESIALVPQLKRPEAAEALVRLALSESGDDIRQAAIAALGRIPGEASERALGSLFEQLISGKLKLSLALDVLDAVRNKTAFTEKLAKYEAGISEDDPVAAYLVARDGGDPLRGKRVFLDHAGVACMRCHKVGKDGGEVGPPLSIVGKQHTRQEILESIVIPNKVIVEGYGQELISTRGDGVKIGRVKSEDENAVLLVLADATEVRIAKSDIRKRKPALSAMPEDLAKMLSKRELRDLVAYLASLK